jgi:hypothetical protein
VLLRSALGQRASPFHILVTSFGVFHRDMTLRRLVWRVLIVQTLTPLPERMLTAAMQVCVGVGEGVVCALCVLPCPWRRLVVQTFAALACECLGEWVGV